MRSLVFEDPAARVRLEKILHPQVGIEMRRQIEQAVSQQVACVIVEIPLLIESAHWRSQLHRIATVDCSIEEQVRRVAARSHLDEREARRFVAAQAKREQRLAASDLVIENSGDYLARLEQQVARVIEHFGL